MLAAKPTIKASVNFYETAGGFLCPDCRAVMSVADQVTENGTVFIWYECAQSGCNGQWLEKKIAEMEVV